MTLLKTSPPEIELVTVPAGKFIMGQVNDEFVGSGRESPAHWVMLEEYQIGRYPVTNAQYLPFVRDTGHPPPITWANGALSRAKANHPVSGVTWSDAWLYCAWLRLRTKKLYHLPTEAQWEKAATWNPVKGQKQPYPWGDEPNDKLCNVASSGPLGTTPVGSYLPQGGSPYGCADMIGNVDEWCNTAMREYPYRAESGCEELMAEGRRAIRGGDWYTVAPPSGIRRNAPSDWWVHLWGFRVALSSALDDAHQKFVQSVVQMETKAREDLATDLKKNANHAQVYATWAHLLWELQNYGVEHFQEMEQTLTKVLELVQKANTGLFRKRSAQVLGFPLCYVYYNRALAQQKLGNYGEAFKDVSQAIELDPTDADIFILRAGIACDLGLWEHAEADLATALQLSPAHPLERITQIRIAKEKQQWETALRLLSEYIGGVLFTPLPHPEFHLWRAEIYEKMGEPDKAVSDYYHYLLWRPDAPEKGNLARKMRSYLQQ